jgi:hypothetical protein
MSIVNLMAVMILSQQMYFLSPLPSSHLPLA